MNKFITKVAKLVLGLSLAAGVGVAVGSQKASTVYAAEEPDTTVDFESTSFTATTGYQGTITDGPTGKQWKFYYGTPSTSSVISGSQSAALRLYTTNNYGYLQTEYQSENVTKVSFKIKAATSNSAKIKVNVQYSSDKSNWSFLKQTSGSGSDYSAVQPGTSASTVTLYMPTAISGDNNVYLKWSIDSSSTKPSKSNAQLTIDDITIYRNISSGDTLSSINLASAAAGTTALTSATVKTGQTLQVYLTGVYSQSGAANKTNEATWTATDGTGSASVNKGLITGLTAGTVTIGASYGGLTEVTLNLTVTQGPTLTLSRHQVNPFHEKETINDITVTAEYFSSTPTITASSNSANVTASILGNGNLQIVAANTVSANETVDITVSATDGVDTVNQVLKVYLKAPVFHLSGSELNLKPSTHGTLTATVEYFKDEVSITATSSNTSSFTASVSGTTITVNATATEGSGTLTVVCTDGTISRTVTADIVVADVLEYDLVSDASTLTEDSQLIIASTVSGNSYAMGAQSGTLRTSISTTVSDGTITGPSSDVKIVTLQGESGAWYLKVDDGYLTYSGSSNNISTTANKADACTWNIAISSNNATISPSTATSRFISYNSSQPRFCVYANVQNNVQIYAIIAAEKTITDQRIETVGTVSASTGDTEWTISGFTFQVEYDNDSQWVTVDNSDVVYSVNIAVPTITQDDTISVNVTGTYNNEVSATANNVTATLTYVAPYTLYSIERLYSATLNQVYYADGVYMGEVADGYIFMNGAYGILVYNNQHTFSLSVGTEYTIHGTIKEYSGLLEFDYTGTTVEEISDSVRIAAVQTPVTYTVVGGETDKTLANRKTELNGYVKSMTSTAQNANSTVVFNVNGNDITVYVKAAEATEKNMTALQANMTANSGLTSNFILMDLEGFTSWHNGFQVSLTQVVVADENYTIYDFARGLLKETLHVCTGGEHDNTTNKAALVAIWDELKGASYYGNLTEQRKVDLAAGTANSAISVPATSAGIDEMSDSDALGAALYRYDFCTAKYDLEEFIVGRTLSVSFGNNISLFGGNAETTTTITLIVIISMVSVTAIGGYFFLKKRREQN